MCFAAPRVPFCLPFLRGFIENNPGKGVGAELLKSSDPGQQVVKIVNDGLTEMLGSETSELMIDVTPPAIVMMVGLQGSGTTTTTAKIAKRLTEQDRKKVLMASLAVHRPAAQEQLATLGTPTEDRKSAMEGRSVSVVVRLGCCRI